MLYRCPYCEFESLNQKNLEYHIKEAHPDKLKGDEGKESKKKKKAKPKWRDNYSLDLDGKDVLITFTDGSSLTGRMKGSSMYEILIESEEGEIVVFKGAIRTMMGLSTEELEEIEGGD